MHVVVRNIGERIVASTDIVVTVLAVRDRAVLFAIEPVAVANPREEGAMVPPQEPNGPYRPSSR